MTLIQPDDAAQLARQRDRMLADAQDVMREATDAAMRDLLRRMRKAVKQQASLTAATPALPRMTSEFFSLGQISGWWEEAVDQHVVDRVTQLWQAGRAASTTADVTVRSQDSLADYLAITRDRLSRTATPTIPDQAFDTVRTSLVDELSRGSSTREITDRLGAELQWQGQDVGFWQDRQAEVNQQISDILDTAGPQFVTDADGRRIENPDRKDLRLNDPTVARLQAESTDASNRIKQDRSTWQTRSERIARTETTAAYNAGAEQAYVEEGAAYKVWLCAPDDRTREAHLEANGTCIAVDDSFDVDGDFLSFPGDPSGSAGNVINCRCTTIAGASCEELTGVAMPAIREVDHERALREDAARQEALAAQEPEPVPTVDEDQPQASLELPADPDPDELPADPVPDEPPLPRDYVRATDPEFGDIEALDLSNANLDGAADRDALRTDEVGNRLRETDEAVREIETELIGHYADDEGFASAVSATDDGLIDKWKTDDLRISVLADNPELEASVGGYQSNGFVNINGALRETPVRGTVPSLLEETPTYVPGGGMGSAPIAQVAKNIDAALDAAPRTPAPVTAYRAVAGGYAETLRNLPVGARQRDRGFMSTTVDPVGKQGAATSYTALRIRVPEGTPALYLNAQGRKSQYWNEQELLLGRGAIFEVVEQGTDYIEVKIVGFARDAL